MEHQDPATARAHKRSRLGLTREDKVLRTKHDAKPTARSKGIPLAIREDVVDYAVAVSVPAASQKYGVSTSIIYRWMERIEPYQMTGNAPRANLVGYNQFLLTMSIYLFPRMSTDERAAFIVANGGSEAYSRQDIYKHLGELHITRKKCNLESHQAYTPQNLLRYCLFWTEPPRSGIANIRRYMLTDTDKCSFLLAKIEAKQGYAHKTHRARDTGNYSRSMGSVNLIMTVEAGNPYLPAYSRGSIQNPRKWWRVTQEATNQVVFSNYIEYVCSDIERNLLPDGFNSQKYFMWDNLRVHTTAMVTAALELRGRREGFRFTPICRPPYQPKIAPIEYIFGKVTNILARKCSKDWNLQRLADEVHSACIEVGLDGRLDRTFAQ